MTTNRVEILVQKLEKGLRNSLQFFSNFQVEDWDQVIYPDPAWTVRSILVHFLSAEQELLHLAQDVAAGGNGVSAGFDIHAFNQSAQATQNDQNPSNLLSALASARQQTIIWVSSLTDEQLDRIGRHPTLGEINVESMLNAIWGHHLLHIREIRSQISSSNAEG
jgi:hypothetical protein